MGRFNVILLLKIIDESDLYLYSYVWIWQYVKVSNGIIQILNNRRTIHSEVMILSQSARGPARVILNVKYSRFYARLWFW